VEKGAGGVVRLVGDLLALPRIAKCALFGVSSVLGVVRFDGDSLLKLASRVITESATPRRFYATLHFLAAVLDAVETVPQAFSAQFVRYAGEKLEMLFGPSLSQVLLILLRKLPPDAAFVALVRRAMPLCGAKTSCLGRMHQILTATAPLANLLNRPYMGQLGETIHPYLTSVMPSLYAAGLRMFEQAALSYPPERCIVGLKLAVDVIADRFVRMTAVPVVPELQFRALMSLLLKDKVAVLHTQLLKLMPRGFTLQNFMPGYAWAVRFWPQVMKIAAADADSFRRFVTIVDSLLGCPASFDVGLKCLKEKLARTTRAQIDAVFMESFRPWMATAGQTPDYQTIRRIRQWFDFVNEVAPSMVHLLTLEFVKGIAPFSFVYINILRMYIRNRKNPAYLQAVKSGATYLEKNCYKNAILLLGQCENWVKLMELASFNDDCEESERLAEELKVL
jgi:hypothetical protein